MHHGTSEDPPNTTPAQTVASVDTSKKKLGRPKKNVTKDMHLARRVQDDAVALGTDLPQEASADVFTTASTQASAKAPKKKRGPYKKKVSPSSTLTTPSRGLTATGSQVSHETAAELSTTTSDKTALRHPRRKVVGPRSMPLKLLHRPHLQTTLLPRCMSQSRSLSNPSVVVDHPRRLCWLVQPKSILLSPPMRHNNNRCISRLMRAIP